jgi:two-component system cell cycle response regulator CtrA
MAMSEHSTGSLCGIRVLIVEDHDDTREALGEYLTAAGALVLTAPTALEAIPQVVMCDVVVTDLAMSGRDGRWLVDQIRMGARPVPVIAVTGYDQDYDLSQERFARVLTKPINPQALAAEIIRLVGRRST